MGERYLQGQACDKNRDKDKNVKVTFFTSKERFFLGVRLVANTKSETMSGTKIKTNMKHLRRRIFQG